MPAPIPHDAAGMRVQWGGLLHGSQWKGITGMVVHGQVNLLNGLPYGKVLVEWDECCKSWVPTSFCDMLNVHFIVDTVVFD